MTLRLHDGIGGLIRRETQYVCSVLVCDGLDGVLREQEGSHCIPHHSLGLNSLRTCELRKRSFANFVASKSLLQ